MLQALLKLQFLFPFYAALRKAKVCHSAVLRTRWSSRSEALKPIEIYLKKIVLLLENMVEDDNQSIDKQSTYTKSYSDLRLYDTD